MGGTTRGLVISLIVVAATTVVMVVALSSSGRVDSPARREDEEAFLRQFAVMQDEYLERHATLGHRFDPRQAEGAALILEWITKLESLDPPD
jgi:hypothetical protein